MFVSRSSAQASVAAVVPWLPPHRRGASSGGEDTAPPPPLTLRCGYHWTSDTLGALGLYIALRLRIKFKVKCHLLIPLIFIRVVTMFSCVLSCCQFRVRFAKCCSQKWRLIPLFCWGYKDAHNSGLANGPGHGHMDHGQGSLSKSSLIAEAGPRSNELKLNQWLICCASSNFEPCI